MFANRRPRALWQGHDEGDRGSSSHPCASNEPPTPGGPKDRALDLTHFRRDDWVGNQPRQRSILFATAATRGEVSDAGRSLSRVAAAVHECGQVDLVKTLPGTGRCPCRSGLDPVHYLPQGSDPETAVRALRCVSPDRRTGCGGVSEHQGEYFRVRQATWEHESQISAYGQAIV